jgi:hypothetical protein
MNEDGYPCEECGKMVTEDHQSVNIGIRITPPLGPLRVHAECRQAYSKLRDCTVPARIRVSVQRKLPPSA